MGFNLWMAMLNGIRDWVRDLDTSVRGNMAERAMAGRTQQLKDFRDDIRTRLEAQNPNYESIASSLADAFGSQRGPAYERDAIKGRLEQGVDIDQLINEAAAARAPGFGVRLNARLSGTSAGDRAVQGVVYGGIGGGVALGLTPAGQGLMALINYMEQGQDTAERRNQELA